MDRRNRPNAFGALMDVVARLPWWVGVALAVLSYVWLHAAASQPVVPTAAPGHIASSVAQSIWKSLATIGQYLIPFACLAGAVVSVWRRKQRKQLLEQATHSPAKDALDGMSWKEFELLVGEAFRRQGYKVVETGGGGADGGVDLVLSKPGQNGTEKLLVQCKQWRAVKVGVDVVRELYGVMAAHGATGGVVVTSGRFTAEAMSFASGRNVTLMDGPKLHSLLRDAQAATSAAVPRPTKATASPPECPLCAKPMVRRTAKRGAHPGQEFWGCSGYPSCRGTRPIA